ncbi:MAG: ATP-dependent helicase C-terminal domain-containing protein [Planctomycetota bacterium]
MSVALLLDCGRCHRAGLALFAPNYRPVEVTTELPSFGQNVSPSVRKELSRKYPRHSWPEDPLAASPESRPKPRRRS